MGFFSHFKAKRKLKKDIEMYPELYSDCENVYLITGDIDFGDPKKEIIKLKTRVNKHKSQKNPQKKEELHEREL